MITSPPINHKLTTPISVVLSCDQWRTQDFFKGGVLKSGPKFAPENLKIVPAEKSLSGGGGGGGGGKRTLFLGGGGSPKKIATTQPAAEVAQWEGVGGGG